MKTKRSRGFLTFGNHHPHESGDPALSYYFLKTKSLGLGRKSSIILTFPKVLLVY